MMTKKIRALYLSYDGLTDPLGQSQILPYLTGLSSQGISFTIVSFEKKEKLEKSENEINEICQQYSIQWIPLVYHKNPPILSTLFDIWKLWQTVKQKNKDRIFQLVHCRSYITSLIGLRAKNKWGVKFIFDMRGFWADERVEGGLWNLRNPLYRLVYDFFKNKEKQFLREADQIISLTHNAKNEIESWGIKSASISVIPTCVDLDFFDPSKIKTEDQNALRKSLGLLQDDFVLLYSGSWGTWYLTESMLHFFAKLKLVKPRAKFLIVSPDPIDLSKHDFRDDIVATRSTRQFMPLHISLASLSICFVKPTFSKKASSATKIGEILAMNVAILVNDGWGDVEILQKNLPGFLVVQNPTETADMNQLKIDSIFPAGRVGATESFSLAAGVNSYLAVYHKLLA